MIPSQTSASQTHPTSTPRVRKKQMARGWFTLLAVPLLGAAAATMLILQSVAVSPISKTPDVLFQNGTDYAALNTAGYATVVLGTSGTTAALSVSGIPGATSTALGKVLKITDTHVTNAYTVTLSRSAAPNAAITSFIVTVKNGATTLATWDAVASATSASFALAVSTSLDISVTLAIADGTAAGAVGSFSIDASIVVV
ncbi:MAG: hypothetical protein QOI63_358 [Thermoplasmata archaeon]|jgi:hypothetical protein|nr:hypothetical protein [Thermoplasmata archaeon]